MADDPWFWLFLITYLVGGLVCIMWYEEQNKKSVADRNIGAILLMLCWGIVMITVLLYCAGRSLGRWILRH